jgi:hypothetical protein
MLPERPKMKSTLAVIAALAFSSASAATMPDDVIDFLLDTDPHTFDTRSDRDQPMAPRGVQPGVGDQSSEPSVVDYLLYGNDPHTFD